MRVLLVKTSSFGDVVHTLPAITDAARAVPGLELHWAVEPDYAEVASLHPSVRAVVPVGLRALKRAPWRIADLVRRLRSERFDLVVDAQGLAKSALIARLATGKRHGFDAVSARESIAAAVADVRHAVPRNLHAIDRTRRLLAAALGYAPPQGEPDYGLDVRAIGGGAEEPTFVLVHGASWTTKTWPIEAWRRLAQSASGAGFAVRVPAYGAMERTRAAEIVAGVTDAHILPEQSLADLARLFARARGVVAVDTGLAHLAAALGRPLVTLYGATAPELTGARGVRVENMAPPVSVCPHLPCRSRTCRLTGGHAPPPCLAALTPDIVWARWCAVAGM